MSVAHVLAYPLITPKRGFIQDFSLGGGGAPIICGWRDGYERRMCPSRVKRGSYNTLKV